MLAYQSSLTGNQGTVPPPSASGVSGILPGQATVNTTRILSLRQFSKDLKTRDIQNIFIDFEDDRGGYRIKWVDDTGCLVVFNEAITAKRAFLRLLANPHPHLLPYINAEGEQCQPILTPYTQDDVPSVIASVQNRPRSRSIAQNNNINNGSNPSTNTTTSPMRHDRRMSNSGNNVNAGGHARVSSFGGPINGSSNSRSFGRQSLSQNQMQAIIDEASAAPNVNSSTSQSNSPPSPVNETAPSIANGGAIDWNSYQHQQQQQTRSRVGSSASFSSPPVAGSPDRNLYQNNSGAISPSRRLRMHQLGGGAGAGARA